MSVTRYAPTIVRKCYSTLYLHIGHWLNKIAVVWAILVKNKTKRILTFVAEVALVAASADAFIAETGSTVQAHGLAC